MEIQRFLLGILAILMKDISIRFRKCEYASVVMNLLITNRFSDSLLKILLAIGPLDSSTCLQKPYRVCLAGKNIFLQTKLSLMSLLWFLKHTP